MKTHALQFDQYGTEATPSWQSVDLPAPTASQVLISVLATDPSAFDLGVQAGDYRDWLPLHFPATYGTEAVGGIKSAGANVDFKPGDISVGMVAAPSQGAFAKETILDGQSLESLPNGVPVDQGLVELTAVPSYLSLFNMGQLQRDQHVLIQGGAGGYSGQEREMLMVVVKQSDFRHLVDHVHHYDPTAFVLVTEATEVHGGSIN